MPPRCGHGDQPERHARTPGGGIQRSNHNLGTGGDWNMAMTTMVKNLVISMGIYIYMGYITYNYIQLSAWWWLERGFYDFPY